MAYATFTVVNIGTLSMNTFWSETDRVRRAHATCTLLETSDGRLLVDPSPEPMLLEERLFATTGLRPDAIDMVFLTHAHGDHRFGIELFAGKPWLMASAGLEEWREQDADADDVINRFLPAEENMLNGIELLLSPGHTHGHHSLLTETEWGRLVVAGDAVMTHDFFNAEQGFHNSVDFQQASETIRRIKARADLVIPGHGNYFPAH